MKSIKYMLALFIPFLMACEGYLFEEDLSSVDPQVNFDYLWKQCDEKYAYFDLKAIDWDEKYTEYSSKLYPEMSDDSLFNVLGGLLRELKDDHTNLSSTFNVAFYGTQNLGPDNFDWRIVTDHYLPSDYYISGPFVHDFLLNSNQEIGYIRFSQFTGMINSTNLNFILNRYKHTKGLIIDLRENGGGAVSDVFALLERFINQKTLIYYSRLKNGKAHTAFSEDQPTYISPVSPIYNQKVMMLIDRGTYSAGSFTALSTMAIPSITLVGDTTGGGLGLPNGGQLPNGWTYRFSITQTLDANLNNEYESGVPPDIRVITNLSDRTKDEVIERAKLEINK